MLYENRVPEPMEDHRASAVAFKAFLAVADRLELPVRERLLLLGIAKSTYTVWLKRLEERELKEVDGDKVDRMAYVLGIYELAGRVFPDGVAWLTRANQAPVFAGLRPLDRMLGGRIEDLLETLGYLKTAARGWA
jgi:DNA-binding transcriptional ArsR family regulator